MALCESEVFASSMEHPERLSPLTLAFMGDAVYELLVRRQLTIQGSMPAHALHQKAVELVRCSAQARAYRLLGGILTEKELSILKRGRNSSSTKCPKHADPIEYRMATGVEALFGYLFLNGEEKRIQELFRNILEHEESPENQEA